MRKKQKSEMECLDVDIVHEIRELLIIATDERRWTEVEDALEIINEELGLDDDQDEEDEVE